MVGCILTDTTINRHTHNNTSHICETHFNENQYTNTWIKQDSEITQVGPKPEIRKGPPKKYGPNLRSGKDRTFGMCQIVFCVGETTIKHVLNMQRVCIMHYQLYVLMWNYCHKHSYIFESVCVMLLFLYTIHTWYCYARPLFIIRSIISHTCVCISKSRVTTRCAGSWPHKLRLCYVLCVCVLTIWWRCRQILSLCMYMH